jgi:hypothetical protein
MPKAPRLTIEQMNKQAKRKATNPEPEDLFSTTARLEARDVPWVQLLAEPSAQTSIPIRFGNKIAGRARASVQPKTNVLALSFTVDNGRNAHAVELEIGSFMENGTRYQCLRCPGCERLRKRLFLRIDEVNPSTAPSLICQYCIGGTSARPRTIGSHRSASWSWSSS